MTARTALTAHHDARRQRRLAALVGGLAVSIGAAACASGGGDSTPVASAPDSSGPDSSGPDSSAPASAATADPIAPAATAAGTTDPGTTVPDDIAPGATIDPVEARTIEQVNEYIAAAAAFDQAGADVQFPAGLTFSAGGAPGYSRYVFREHSEGVVPSLVEGPIAGAVRCQDEASPCSFPELKALHESGEGIPEHLQISADELAVLVDQLSELNAFAEAHHDVDAACAAGFISDRIQTANMGSHFYQPAWVGDGFDPGAPEILLYARSDGQLPNGPVAQCENGAWTGQPMDLVGTAFLIPPNIIGNDHPDTFAGPLDNWHIHYNLCRGAAQGRDSFVPEAQCTAQGGNFSAALGWMLHAWVADDYENQLGVFGMWNSAISPVLDAASIRELREVQGSDFPDGAQQSLITDFLFSGDLTVQPDQPLFFNNVDAVPHTVTAGTPEEPVLDDFDSGVLTPGSNFELSFDDPGVYSLFCTLHPDMVATVTVEE